VATPVVAFNELIIYEQITRCTLSAVLVPRASIPKKTLLFNGCFVINEHEKSDEWSLNNKSIMVSDKSAFSRIACSLEDL